MRRDLPLRVPGRSLGPALTLALACGACTGPPPPPPSAVVAVRPGSVCVHDAFHTDVVLDANESSPRLTLVPEAPPPGEPPLVYRWTLEGDEHRITSGDLSSAALHVQLAGERPMHATLTVTNGEGGEASTLRTISITVPDFAPCATAADCIAGERCAGGVCAPGHDCATDADCEACFACDVAARLCVPRAGAGP